MNKPTDYFGNEFEVGDIVAYPTGRDQMNHGKVEAIVQSKRRYTNIDVFKLSVLKIGRSSYATGIFRDAEPCKPSLIERCERVIILNKTNGE